MVHELWAEHNGSTQNSVQSHIVEALEYCDPSVYGEAMNRSSSRVLTTHVGSLVRPGPIAEVLRAESLGQAIDEGAFERLLGPAVADVVRTQAEVGVDVPSDGEFGKTMWTQYVAERVGGIERRELASGSYVAPNSKDRQDFAEFYAIYNPISVTMWRILWCSSI
jgi:5-methyltetrahydropteroyltriglutamate--homocysteine methyltransferase